MAGTVVTLRPGAQPQLPQAALDALDIFTQNDPHRCAPNTADQVADYMDAMGGEAFGTALAEIELALGVLIDVDEAILCGTVGGLIAAISAKHDAAQGACRRQGGTIYFLEGYRKAVAEARARAEMRAAIGQALAIPSGILKGGPATRLANHTLDTLPYVAATPIRVATPEPDAPTPAPTPAPKPKPAPQEAEPAAARGFLNWRDVVMACAIGLALAVLCAMLQPAPPAETAAQAALREAVR